MNPTCRYRYTFIPVASESDIPAGMERAAKIGEIWRNADGSIGFNCTGTCRTALGYLVPLTGDAPVGYALITDAFGTEIYAKLSTPGTDAVALPQRRVRGEDSRGNEEENERLERARKLFLKREAKRAAAPYSSDCSPATCTSL